MLTDNATLSPVPYNSHNNSNKDMRTFNSFCSNLFSFFFRKQSKISGPSISVITCQNNEQNSPTTLSTENLIVAKSVENVTVVLLKPLCEIIAAYAREILVNSEEENIEIICRDLNSLQTKDEFLQICLQYAQLLDSTFRDYEQCPANRRIGPLDKKAIENFFSSCDASIETWRKYTIDCCKGYWNIKPHLQWQWEMKVKKNQCVKDDCEVSALSELSSNCRLMFYDT